MLISLSLSLSVIMVSSFTGDLISWAVVVMGNVDMELLKRSVIALAEMMDKMGLNVIQKRPTLIAQLDREKFEGSWLPCVCVN